MFSRQFTTNHLDSDYVYEVIHLMQRLGWADRNRTFDCKYPSG